MGEKTEAFYEIENVAIRLAGVARIVSTDFLRVGHPDFYSRAVATIVLIDLADIMNFLDRRGRRIATKDFVPEGTVDLHEHLRIARGAACHSHSKTKNVFKDLLVIDFNRFGPGHPGIQIMTEEPINLRCEFDDDMAFAFGRTIVYHTRHLKRAVNDCLSALRAMAASEGRSFDSTYEMIASRQLYPDD